MEYGARLFSEGSQKGQQPQTATGSILSGHVEENLQREFSLAWDEIVQRDLRCHSSSQQREGAALRHEEDQCLRESRTTCWDQVLFPGSGCSVWMQFERNGIESIKNVLSQRMK
ncbi:hypothetical protein AV530_016139 [Patagioenas fasciata monilis]|uniref:Uncharacterized protein n=1 Tax=Patagioenas fasciata monilis TaxID=372326 RepID=A0A1V4JW82_PATFA|nr:hypothetical protein AV530_016139 [Patagioenas fasciata monilis]